MILVISQDEYWLHRMEAQGAYTSTSMDVSIPADVTVLYIDEMLPYAGMKFHTFIVVTNMPTVGGAIKAHRAGALDYITKSQLHGGHQKDIK